MSSIPLTSRRALLAFLGASALAVPLAVLGRPADAAAEEAGECSLEDRDLEPYKGFASTRPGSGGQCTTHAARRFDTVAPEPGVNWHGNAAYWYDNAAAMGWAVGNDLQDARPGALVIWGGGAGHVAFIEHVTPDGIEVSEMNWSQQMCSWSSRYRTSMWGRVDYASLTWDEVRTRLWHRFVGYIYPYQLTD